jgi:hypothetical protein
MNKQIDLLAISLPLETILYDHDIHPEVVIRWLIEEGLIDINKYFEEAEDETSL